MQNTFLLATSTLADSEVIEYPLIQNCQSKNSRIFHRQTKLDAPCGNHREYFFYVSEFPTNPQAACNNTRNCLIRFAILPAGTASHATCCSLLTSRTLTRSASEVVESPPRSRFGFVGYDSVPFDDGTPVWRASTATASRSARAVALNSASATWWLFDPWCRTRCKFISAFAASA